MAGPYGGGGSSSGSPYGGVHVGAAQSHDHGFLGNLLSDVLNTTKGIVPGIEQTVEHPIRSVKATLSAEKALYSPLVHGQFGTFWHNVESHPLYPLLDALSVASFGAGSVGKVIDVASRGAEEGSSLSRLAEHFQPLTEHTTKELPTHIAGGEPMSVHYSTNIFRRAMLQKPWESVLTAAGKAPITKKIFGEGGAYDYTPLGRGERMLRFRGAEHKAGAASQSFREAYAANKVARKAPNTTPEEFAHALMPGIQNSVFGHALKVDPAKAEAVGKDSEWRYVHKAAPFRLKAPESMAPEHISQWVREDVPKYFRTTRDPANALQDDEGKLLMIHRELPRAAAGEADRTLKALHAIYSQPTKVWKWLVLAQAPRYFVNNFVGQSLMLAMAHNPVAVSQGIYHAIKDVHGAKVAEREGRSLGGELEAQQARFAGTWQHKWYLGAHKGPASELEQAGKFNAKQGLKHGLYSATEKFAYTGHRMAGINVAMMEVPEFRQLYARYRKSMGRDEAFSAAADKASANPVVRSYVEKRSSDWAGQYHHSNALENALRTVVPFYSWDRHALRFAKEQLLGRPVASNVLTHVGSEGNTYIQKRYGNLPDFMRSAVPGGGGLLSHLMGGVTPGRDRVILTQGLNPLSAAGEDVGAVGSLLGVPGATKEAVASQLNPIVSGALSALTGQDIFSGAKIKEHGGILGTTALQTVGAIPQEQLIQSLVHGPRLKTSAGNPTLYTHDVRSQIASLLGLSVRDFSPAAAQKLYAEQQPKSKSSKKRKSPYG